MIALAGDAGLAIAIVVATVLAIMLVRERAQMRELGARHDGVERRRAGLDSILGTIPLAGFLWPVSGGRERRIGAASPAGDSPGAAVTSSRFADFAAALAAEDAARLEAALGALRRDGTAFAATVATPGGTTYEITGSRAAGGESVLWLLDATPVQRAERDRAIAAGAAGTLRATFDAIPLPVWRRGADFELADCNAAYAAALDAPRETVLAQSRELAAVSGRDKALALARATAGGGARTERRHVVIAGSRRLIEVTEIPDRAGGTVGFAVDRTDVETTAAELTRHINAHAEVLGSIHVAVAIYGADKRLKFFNAGFAALWGIEEEWLRGEPALDEVLERLRERRRIPEFADFRVFKRQQLEMFTSLIEPQQELMHLPDDRTLSLMISPHPFGGLTFVYEDVTDRLALESSFNTLSEVQRETLDHLFEGIAVYGSDGRLKLHNPAYREIWGLSEADIAGEPHISEIVEKIRAFYDDGSDWPAMKQQVIAKITAQTLASEPLDRQDGSVLQMATVPLPDGNVLVTCLDVSDTARVERALRERNEALETAGRLKSEFIANVSYELRTPLNAIIGFAEILTDQYFGTLNPRQIDYSRGILDSSHRLMSLINDILDLATIEAGYMVIETGEVEIGEMMQAVVTLTHERARNQDVALALTCPADIGALAADERRLKQALFNLVSNAIKFTPAGGAIAIEAAREEDELVLTVADTGVGIPDADQVRIFEKFERGNPQARQSGAGLGLSLVKSLIELHGGRVEIESKPGQGTTVRCRLPARPAAEVGLGRGGSGVAAD